MKKLIFVFLLQSMLIMCFSQNLVKTQIDSVKTLNIKVDSLEKELNKIKPANDKSFEIIKQVTDYYENAWTKLLYLLTILGATIGVIFPYYLSKQQKKEFEINKNDFKDMVNNQIRIFEDKITKFNLDEIDKSKKQVTDEIEFKVTNIYSMTYYLQALHFYNISSFNFALKGYIDSLTHQIKANDIKHVDVTLGGIKQCISQLNQKKIKIEPKLIDKLKILFDKLNSITEYKHHSNIIDEILEVIK